MTLVRGRRISRRPPIARRAAKEVSNYSQSATRGPPPTPRPAYGYMKGRPGACIVVTGRGRCHGLDGRANAQTELMADES